MNLFDILQGAGAGHPFAALAKQCGLSESEVAKAVQAFLPAFSAGLKRSTADPFGLAEFMRKLASGDYAEAYRSPGAAWTGAAGNGHDALSFVFGSPEGARAVAAAASQFTGLAQEKLAQLFPAMAAMMFGGLAQQSAAANPVLAAMMDQFRAAAPAKTAPKGPLDRYEDDQAEKERQDAARFGNVPQEVLQAGLAAFQSGAAAWQKSVADMMAVTGAGAAGADKAEKPGGGAGFGSIFEPGQRVGEAYQREIERILERYRSAGKGS